MRRILLAGFAVLLASASVQAQRQNQNRQQESAAEGLACFENLAAPEYSRAALQAHVDGSVWTTTHVSPQGTIDKIDTQVVSAWDSASKLLLPAAEKAVRAAKIKADCAGKTVRVVFRYELHGDPTPNPETTSRMDPPYVVWIDSQAMPGPETSAVNKVPAKPQH